MFDVISLDGTQEEPLTKIGKDFKMEQSVDGTFTVSFSTFAGYNPAFDLLQSESVVAIADYKFKVKQFSKKRNGKTVAAINEFFELAGTRIDSIFGGSHTLANHLNFILGGTGWHYTIDPSIADITNYIDKLGDSNRIALIEKLCKYHQCEYIILPGNMRVHFAKQVGGDDDYQYRYKHNISEVVLKEDTNDLYTFIKGYGADGLEVSYTSPNASIFGIKEADPIRDERFTDPVALTEYIKAQLQDVPELAIESRIPELTERETGERIWLIYEPLGIELQTRILKQTKVIRDGKLVTESVVFGNTLIKSSVDLLVEQQIKLTEAKEELTESIETTKEEINETIDETVREINFKFHETETLIEDQYTTITNEYSASISANAREFRTEMNQLSTTVNTAMGAQYAQITAEYNSSISQTAQAIRTDVTASITSVNTTLQNVQNYASSIEQTAQYIQSQVSTQQVTMDAQGTRIYNAESSITQHANEISQKVSQVDYNGVAIASLINQTAYDVSISASKINLTGAVIVDGTISGASSIDVSNSATIGTTLQIGQDWQASYPKAIRFAGQYSTAGIAYNNGTLTISAVDAINLDADNINILGNLSGSIDAATVNGFTLSTSTNGGKRYVTFRQFGSYLGQVELAA